MTYSHNSVSKNLKMTTGKASSSSSAIKIREKNVSHGGDGGGGGGGSNSPPSPLLITPPLSAHSSSIASSTKYNYTQQQQQQQQQQQLPQQLLLDSSPPGSCFSSSASTSSNCSSSTSASSLGSSGNGGRSYFTVGCKHQIHQEQQQQQRVRKQQRRSPAQHQRELQQQRVDAGNRVRSLAPKQSRLPKQGQGAARHCGASELADYLNQTAPAILGNSSTRKVRPKRSSPVLSFTSGGGKFSPTQQLLPTALTHFAGSKCFDAPAPTALPKPPEHWTLKENSVASGAGLHNIFNRRHSMGCGRISIYTMDPYSCGGNMVKSSKRNLLDDFDTHNLKVLLKVQS